MTPASAEAGNRAALGSVARQLGCMFSGIVTGTGEILAIEDVEGASIRLAVDVSVLGREPQHGASIAVAGVCLTVVAFEAGRAEFDVIGQTMRLTTLGDLSVGDRVNLEGALRVGDEIGGHEVQGHVDAVGCVSVVEQRGDETWMTIEAPDEVMKTLAPKGWIAVDGISLTVADLLPTTFSVALIPTTLAVTTLGGAKLGTRVNLEGDPLGKHVGRWLEARGAQLSFGSPRGMRDSA